jgi:hypothetical protein
MALRPMPKENGSSEASPEANPMIPVAMRKLVEEISVGT